LGTIPALGWMIGRRVLICMQIPPLIALESITLKSGRLVVRGEIFDPTFVEAQILTRRHKAIFERDLQPLPAPAQMAGRYRRRDLRAED